MKQHEEIIIFDTDEAAAKKITVTGWVSRNGRFYGDNESMARYDGCTHKKCECGNKMTKGWTSCNNCINKKNVERWENYPFKEFSEEDVVCELGGDKYFFDQDEIECYLEDNELEPEDLLLVICEQNHYGQISYDYWQDDMPEDGELPKELVEKLDEINKFILTLPVQSWSPGKIRTEYKRAN